MSHVNFFPKKYLLIPFVLSFVFTSTLSYPVFSRYVCINNIDTYETTGVCLRSWMASYGSILVPIFVAIITVYFQFKQIDVSRIEARERYLQGLHKEQKYVNAVSALGLLLSIAHDGFDEIVKDFDGGESVFDSLSKDLLGLDELESQLMLSPSENISNYRTKISKTVSDIKPYIFTILKTYKYSKSHNIGFGIEAFLRSGIRERLALGKNLPVLCDNYSAVISDEIEKTSRSLRISIL